MPGHGEAPVTESSAPPRSDRGRALPEPAGATAGACRALRSADCFPAERARAPDILRRRAIPPYAGTARVAWCATIFRFTRCNALSIVFVSH